MGRFMKEIVHSAGSYRDQRFADLRLSERRTFPPGEEIGILFTGHHPTEGFAMARLAAMVYAGLFKGPELEEERFATVPFVQELGPFKGHVTGRQTQDKMQGWRIDLDKHGPPQFHINWWDRRADPGSRSRQFYGANYVTDGTEQLFWEIESHFPGRVRRCDENR